MMQKYQEKQVFRQLSVESRIHLPFTEFCPAKSISQLVGLRRGVDAGGDLAYPLEGKNV